MPVIVSSRALDLPSSFEVVESFVLGKLNDPHRCEDVLVVTPGWLGVIDGATDKSKVPWPVPDGGTMTSGRFAALAVRDAFETLPADMDPHDVAAHLTQYLAATALAVHPDLPADMPSASVAAVSRTSGMAFSVGDIAVMVDGGPPLQSLLPHDGYALGVRAAFNYATRIAASSAFATSRPTDDTADIPEPNGTWPAADSPSGVDAGTALVWPLLEVQWAFENDPDPDNPFAYGAINGTPVPHHLIRVFDVSDASHIAFASDGYPAPAPTLAESEAALTAKVAADPQGIRPPFQFRGVQPSGAYDDRAFLAVARN